MHGYKRLMGILLLTLMSGAAQTQTQTQTSVWKESYALQAEGDLYQAAQVLLQNRKTAADEYATLRIGYLSYLRGNHNDAIRFYEKAIKMNPESIDAQLGIALPLMAQQRWRRVKAQMNHLLKKAPQHYGAHVKLMIAEEALAQWKTLAKHAKALTRSYPSDATSWVYLARANAWLGETEAAKRAYRQVLKRIPEHIEANAFMDEKG